jgi:hypothetical protein
MHYAPQYFETAVQWRAERGVNLLVALAEKPQFAGEAFYLSVGTREGGRTFGRVRRHSTALGFCIFTATAAPRIHRPASTFSSTAACRNIHGLSCGGISLPLVIHPGEPA